MYATQRELDEPRLARLLRKRDADALAELYDSYGRLAYHVIVLLVGNAATAEDLTQETFLRIWNSAAAFDGSRGSLKGWVLAVARHRAIDYLRSVEGRMGREAVELDGAKLTGVTARGGAQFLAQEAAHLIRQAMATLTPNQKLVLELCYSEGMTHEEIANRLDCPLGTVKTWIRRSVQRLREVVGQS